ncbi:PspA/IM30 family protein [Paenibacillus sp. CF384]|uniref:PspA/IM30 family protein n=1 Tax=Paenibacillus sp. CF384 TaxID=1884382 RepID=UPI00089496AC|nr:PspA/IM30 family protein [Paenibacillus sp. CF384]SDX35304.1 phage shock protein A (PspA) family protein [Paenibacillus sp. CF384]
MGILSRFRDVMKANMHGWHNHADNPEKTVKAYMESLHSDLGQVKAETAAVLLKESRAKRELDECSAEIKKLQRYAEKSAESGEDENALKFLDLKSKQAAKCAELQPAYDQASAKATMMKHMQDKLESDLAQLEARYTELQGKMVDAANAQHQQVNSEASAAFSTMEEKANRALNEATALAELRAEAQEEDLDVLIAKLEKQAEAGTTAASAAAVQTTPEDELTAIKDKLKSR